MSDRTAIPWTDATWNPVVGCSHASPGCDNCYAERMARRLRAMGRPGYAEAHDGTGWTARAVCIPERLSEPLRWRKPRRVFVCSMGDLFHPSVPDEFIHSIYGVMAACPQHTFQVLTKRPEKAAYWYSRIARTPEFHRTEMFRALSSRAWPRGLDSRAVVTSPWPLPNVWLGTTVEDQQRADERIPHLLRCPAAVRFVSCEPLLGPVDLTRWLGGGYVHAAGDGRLIPANVPIKDLHWVIVGGESGPGARPMHPAWARSLRDQAVAAGVPFFYKQDGGLHGGGHLLDGREWREVPS